jgi:hypothetical protein
MPVDGTLIDVVEVREICATSNAHSFFINPPTEKTAADRVNELLFQGWVLLRVGAFPSLPNGDGIPVYVVGRPRGVKGDPQ